MKKTMFRLATVAIILSMLFSLSGCDFGSKRITEVEQYGQMDSHIALPEFFPDSVEAYVVNSYAYNLESWMDTCYEIFLDITVSKDQYEELLSEHTGQAVECYYASGYYEVVFEDSYDLFDGDENRDQVVGFADIEKIIFNPEIYRIVFVAFHANDTGVYPLKDVAYFNCFDIDENGYVAHHGKED